MSEAFFQMQMDSLVNTCAQNKVVTLRQVSEASFSGKEAN